MNEIATFEEVILPHITAAYNLARWLTRNDHDAQDVVQEAYMRAFKFFGGFRGGDGRSRLLKIVRNTCYTWLQKNQASDFSIVSDDEIGDVESDDPKPETLLLKKATGELLKQALNGLPLEFREVVILREPRRPLVQADFSDRRYSDGYGDVTTGPRTLSTPAAPCRTCVQGGLG